MAYTREKKNKVVGSSLDSFIKNLSYSLSRQITERNAQDELVFNKLVLEQNISLEAQLNFRKEQLTRFEDLPEEKLRITNAIADLKNRIEVKVFNDSYGVQLTSLSSGATSINAIVDWLREQKAATTNQTILDSIDKQLVDAETKKFEYSKQLIDNQTNYALNDRSNSVLNDQINNVENAKNSAILAGDKTLAASYDLQLQSLTKAKIENSIEKAERDLSVAKLTGGKGAMSVLDALNSKIASASTDGAITIGENTFSSERDYWTFSRDTYVSDDSSKGLMAKLNKEINDSLAVKNSKNTITAQDLKAAAKIYDKLVTRPEMRGYEDQVAVYKQDSLQTAADYLAKTITNKYATDNDINKAVSAFKGLADLGVNVNESMTNAISNNAALKSTMTSAILSRAQELVNDGLSVTAAYQQAQKEGYGNYYSPEDMLNKSAGDIGSEMMNTSENLSGKEDPRLTLGDNKPLATTPTPSVNNGTYQIRQGDTLSAIAAKNKTTVGEIMKLNPNITNPNLIIAGQKINLTQSPAPTTGGGGTTPTPSATPNPYGQLGTKENLDKFVAGLGPITNTPTPTSGGGGGSSTPKPTSTPNAPTPNPYGALGTKENLDKLLKAVAKDNKKKKK